MVATQNLEATIVGLEEERLTAMVAADVDTLDRILADDLSYESITPTAERAIRTYSDSAIVRGGAHVHVNGNHFSLEYTVVYVNNDDNWQMTSWHATRLP